MNSLKFKTLKQNQKIRVYINNIKIVGTVKQVLTMVQDYSFDAFMQKFDELRLESQAKGEETQGFGTKGETGTRLQVDVIKE